jgi:hypothetical protein
MKTKSLTLYKIKKLLFLSMYKRLLQGFKELDKEAKIGITKGDQIVIEYKAVIDIS